MARIAVGDWPHQGPLQNIATRTAASQSQPSKSASHPYSPSRSVMRSQDMCTAPGMVPRATQSLGDPWVDLMGLPETGTSGAPLVDVLEEDLSQWLNRQKPPTLRDDDALNDGLKKVTRGTAQEEIGKRPEVTVVVSRLG